MKSAIMERTDCELAKSEAREAVARERHPEVDRLFEIVEEVNQDMPFLGELVTDEEDAAIWAAVDALRDAVEAVAGRLGGEAAEG